VIDLAELQFHSAIWIAVHDRDKRPLLNLLRSDFQLSAETGQSLPIIEEKLKCPRGRRPWRATDELHDPESADVRRAAPLCQSFQGGRAKTGEEDKWAVEQALKTLEERGFRAPPEDRLENYLRRSRKPRKRVPR
jgi:hypothetical protein